VRKYFSDIDSSSEKALRINIGSGECIFLVGIPGSGKSTYKNQVIGGRQDIIDMDPDEIKLSHNLYRDIDLDINVHYWSKEVLHNYFFEIVDSEEQPPFVWDTTGMDDRDLYLKMRIARNRGYRVYVVWILVPHEIAIYRNRRRPRYERDELYIKEALGELESKLSRLVDAGEIKLEDFYVYSKYNGEELERALEEFNRIPVSKYSDRPIKLDDSEKRYRREPGVAIKSYESKREVLMKWLRKMNLDRMSWREFVGYYIEMYRKVYGKEFEGLDELEKFFRHFKPLFTRRWKKDKGIKELTLEYLVGLGEKQACVRY
jgi:predicted kinase